MKLQRHGVRAQLLDRLAQPELALVRLEAELAQRLGDVRRGHRSKQRVGVAHSAGDDDFDPRHPGGNSLGGVLFMRFLGVEPHPLTLDVLSIAGCGRQGQLPRQQVVARIAVGHLHHLATLPDFLDVISQYDFHIF